MTYLFSLTDLTIREMLMDGIVNVLRYGNGQLGSLFGFEDLRILVATLCNKKLTRNGIHIRLFGQEFDPVLVTKLTVVQME